MGKQGAMYFSGKFAGSALNDDIDSVEKWLHYIMSSFVLYHDQANKSCNVASGVFGMGSSKPDYGHCYLPLAQEDGAPLWEGPIFPYSDGKGNDFNISLMVKADQIRGLESLQVQSSRCFGNIVSNGGLCKLELSPGREGITVTNLEVEIFCQGSCSLSEHIASALKLSNVIDIGKTVMIYKEGMNQKCTGPQYVVVRNIFRCDGQGKKCNRYCLQDPATKRSGGCWDKSNLLTEKECAGVVKQLGDYSLSGFRKLKSWAGYSSNSGEAKSSRVSLLYRKFNAVLKDVKVRTDVYIFRTRSLIQVVNEDEEAKTDESKNVLARGLDAAFGGVAKALDMIAHPTSATKSQRELIEKYKFNLQPKRDKFGNVLGYELVTCSQFVWNPETEDYDQPPLKKCQKIRLVNLELLATKPDYLEVQELARQEEDDSVSGGAPGVILSIVAKLARMMFIRTSVTMMAPDPDDPTTSRFCKDMWTKGATEDKSYAVGVLCSASKLLEKDEDEVGEGIDARFEFEIVELKPKWNDGLKKNEIYVGIRGGYDLDFCRVLTVQDPKTKLAPGMVVCDFKAPNEEGTRIVLDGTLPEEAIFKLEHIKRNDVKSTVTLGAGASSAESACDDCEEKSTESAQAEVESEMNDNANVLNELPIRLYNTKTQKYCSIEKQKFKTYAGMFTKTKKLLSCTKDIELTPDKPDIDSYTELLMTLSGNTDSLVPSQYWNFLIVISLSCIGATAGLTAGKWTALLGGAGMLATFTTVVGTAAAGAAAGYYISESLKNNWHIDGIMLRYLLKVKFQALGQQILFAIESALDFELPRP
mmetsp:Transcript_38289/g.88514  ORF Transcript_38289/g.88514 Transcript_38289/m.88514 type:complete len:813 (-) Transcript_38289:189-2627(-)